MRARTRPHKKKDSAFADFGATGFGAGFFVKQQWLLAEYDRPEINGRAKRYCALWRATHEIHVKLARA
jgi:hypothetical protein